MERKLIVTRLSDVDENYRQRFVAPENSRKALSTKAATGAVGLTVAQAIKWRGNCRDGLGGVQMKHRPSGLVFTCAGSSRTGETSVVVYPVTADGYWGETGLRGTQVEILSPWPVVGIGPSGPRPRAKKPPG